MKCVKPVTKNGYELDTPDTIGERQQYNTTRTPDYCL